MAYPPAYERTFSFTEWETLHPGEPKPGADLDAEFDDVSVALTATQDALALIQRDDGALANDSVGEDQLQDDVFDGIVDGITADAEAARDAAAAHAAAAAGSALAADASADAASTSEANAAGSAALAGTSQSIAQDAANEAAASATEAAVSADEAELAANETAGSVAETQAAVDLAFKWAEYLAGPVMPAPDGYPEAVDDGMWSSKWWALKARDYSQLTQVDFGAAAGADIGEAYDNWGGTLPPGNVIASWNGDEYWLVDPANPSDPASWVKLTGDTGATGPTGPANSLAIGTVTTLPPGSPATATITGTPPSQTLSLGIPQGASGSGGSGAGDNPTALVGLTAINGVATTLIRSDGAPALDQAIVPTWTGEHTFRARVYLNPDPQTIPVAAIHSDARAIIADDAAVSLQMLAIGAAVSLGTRYWSAGGTFAAPSAVTVAGVTYMAFMGAGGHDGTAWQLGSAALVTIRPLATWSGTQRPTRVTIETTPVGSVTRSEIASFSNAAIDFTSTAFTWNGNALITAASTPVTWTGNHTFTGTVFNLEYLLPRLRFTETDAAVANKVWAISVNGEQFDMAVFDDTMSAKANFMAVNRTAQVIDAIDFTSTALRHNANIIPNVTSTVTWTGRHTFTFLGSTASAVDAAINIQATIPTFAMYETDADADEKGWNFIANSGQFLFRACNDAGSAATNIMFVDRTGTAIDSVTFPELVKLGPKTAQEELLRLHATSPYVSFYNAAGTTRIGYVQGNSVSNTVFISSDNGPISFNTAGATRMTLDATGNLAVLGSYIKVDRGIGNATLSHYMEFAANPGTVFGSVFVFGMRSGYAGYSIYDGVLYPLFMSNGNNAGIIIPSEGWLIVRSTSTQAICGYNLEATSFNVASSRKLKRETGAPKRAADILSRLRPILYRLLKDESKEQLGMIAEEVHEVCPQMSDGKTISYDRLAVLLLADWQEAHGVA